jgi:hypothetical protein
MKHPWRSWSTWWQAIPLAVLVYVGLLLLGIIIHTSFL